MGLARDDVMTGKRVELKANQTEACKGRHRRPEVDGYCGGKGTAVIDRRYN